MTGPTGAARRAEPPEEPELDRYTDRARLVLQLAEAERAGTGAPALSTAHLLLGLAVEWYGLAAAALRSAGVNVEEARVVLAEAAAGTGAGLIRDEAVDGTGPAPGRAGAPVTTGVDRALAHAEDRSRALGTPDIRTEHLLLGLLEVEPSAGRDLLAAFGVDVEALRRQVAHQVDEGGTDAAGAAGAARNGAPRPPAVAYPLPRPVDLPPGTPRPGVRPLGAPPRCPSCGAGMAGRLGYRRTDAEDADGEERPVPVIVVHCGACGCGVGVIADT